MKRKYQMQQIGESGSVARYAVVAEGVSEAKNATSIEQQYGRDTSFLGSGEIGDATYSTVVIGGKSYEFINYGEDNNTPYILQQLLRKNMVAQRAMAFNVQCCYGQGLRFIDRETKQDVADAEIRKFCLSNSIHEIGRAHV